MVTVWLRPCIPQPGYMFREPKFPIVPTCLPALSSSPQVVIFYKLLCWILPTSTGIVLFRAFVLCETGHRTRPSLHQASSFKGTKPRKRPPCRQSRMIKGIGPLCRRPLRTGHATAQRYSTLLTSTRPLSPTGKTSRQGTARQRRQGTSQPLKNQSPCPRHGQPRALM